MEGVVKNQHENSAADRHNQAVQVETGHSSDSEEVHQRWMRWICRAQWRARLKRHFWRAGYVETLLHRLGHGDGARSCRHARRDRSAPGRQRRRAARRAAPARKSSPAPWSSAAEAAGLRLDPAIADAIAKLFDISGPGGRGAGAISALCCKTAGITLDAPLAAMEARLTTITVAGRGSADKCSFTAHFGRNMEYYTGFVFELWARDKEGPVQVAGGGRYDTLMEMLGASSPVSAIGCAIRTERVLAARQFAGGA